MDIIDLPHDEVVQERVSLKSTKPKAKPVKVVVEHYEISENIRKFDNRVKVHKQNPYSHNAVALNRSDRELTPTANNMAADPTYNMVGKSLGLDTAKEWNQYYDKVHQIVEWARRQSKTKDTSKLIKFISDLSRKVPTMGSRRIDDIYIYTKFNKK